MDLLKTLVLALAATALIFLMPIVIALMTPFLVFLAVGGVIYLIIKLMKAEINDIDGPGSTDDEDDPGR